MTRDFDESEWRAFGWTLRDVFRLFQRAWNRRLRESGSGLSPAQSQVLGALRQHDGLTQTELADEIGVEKAPLGRLLDRMDELGLVERRSDPGDRRVRRVYYAARAEAMEPEMWRAAFDMFEVALDGLTVGERRTLLDLLGRLKQNLLAAEQRPEPRDGAEAKSRRAALGE